MGEKMLQFVQVGRAMPPKREGRDRRHDFDEIYAEFPSERAAAQAARCSQCGVPFCQAHCPLSNAIPDWLKLTAEGRLEEAYDLSSATNPMPEICGRICPQDRLCEGACVIEQSGHGTVTIGAVEKYIAETAWTRGWVKPLTPLAARAQSVGIVGAGPAGLACAESLRRLGYRVTVYDRHDRAGGLLIYGIPNFKLDKTVVQRRIDRLQNGGIAFRLNCEVGRDVRFADLREEHDALFIATGVYRAREMEVAGGHLHGIVPALDYLIAANRLGLGDKPNAAREALNAKNQDVVVIGGGDTAMDALRTAIRQGARSVSCLYRRDRANMPGSARETANAEEEGVHFHWLSLPKAFEGDQRVAKVHAARMRLALPDALGRKVPEEIPGETFTLPATLVIKALGFTPEDQPARLHAPALTANADGTLAIAPETFMTELPGVFAGGDIVRGASLVVWAVRDGRDAAAAIHRYIQSGSASAAKRQA